jgi:peptidoglycan hydrolase-like protein with peptidoglycan-binding domain
MNLKLNSKGDLVKDLQKKLAEAGFDPGPVDGIFGKRTQKAVVKFQKSKKLKENGVAGMQTLEALGVKLKPAKFKETRESFKLLQLSNPNYFGNLIDSPFKPVETICCSTFYEEMVCLGYHPQRKQLEAVINVYQESGYGTDICGFGTPEFVRFYLSFDDGATWQDQGVTSFQVYNIPEGTKGKKHLEYAASLAIEPPVPACWRDPLIKVRAILSWNDEPDPDTPDWTPVWGNTLENTILLETFRLLKFRDILEELGVKLPLKLEKIIDPDKMFPAKSKPLGVPELAKLYKDKKVPVHRFAYKELMAYSSGKIAGDLKYHVIDKLKPDLKINKDIIGQLKPIGDGDTSYEELTCVGLDPNHPDTLVGVIKVKKPSGYSGDPCDDGSLEYVTFWADFDDNGTFETCLGTATVQVYDIEDIPPEGIHYAVRLPVDLDPYRKPCKTGPVLVRVRAILSWNVPVPCANPNQVPRWGNREETLINIAPAMIKSPGKIAILGGIPVGHIHNVSGLTTADAIFATNNLPPDPHGRPSPFARRVTVQGAPISGWSYKVEVSKDGAVWTPQVTDLKVTDMNGETHDQIANGTTMRFHYKDFNDNVNGLLAQWNSSGNEKWYVRLTVYDGGGIAQGSDTHVIQLHNSSPTASIDITTGTGNCGKFPSGITLEGKFVARGDYLRGYSLYVHPNVNAAGVGVPDPKSGLVNTAAAPGDDWELDTTDMVPCGYTIHVGTRNRAIVNSQSVGLWAHGSAGFCIEEPE